jgi:hypothetical protein
MIGSPTSIQPARKKKVPQINHADIVPGPLITTANTTPEISHVLPTASSEQDMRRRSGTDIGSEYRDLSEA